MHAAHGRLHKEQLGNAPESTKTFKFLKEVSTPLLRRKREVAGTPLGGPGRNIALLAVGYESA